MDKYDEHHKHNEEGVDEVRPGGAEENNSDEQGGLRTADDEHEPAEPVEAEADNAEDKEDAPVGKTAAVVGAATAKQRAHHRAWHWLLSHKKITIPALVLLVLAVLAAVPYTRYTIAGTVVRKNYTVTVLDSQTNKPVSSAQVTLEGKQVTTDNEGKATIRANVGYAKIAVSKKYYQPASQNVLVPLGSPKTLHIALVATGRQVPVSVVNKISGQPVENATVTADGTNVRTDKNGKATIVLPANKASLQGTVGGSGYNSAPITVKITSQTDPANTFAITPGGKIYFLSNASGKIDVVKTDLDGQNRQTVLAGTGREDANNTALIPSPDWKYLALLSQREGGDNPKLYLIETATDKITTMDEGDADFTLIGWAGPRFVYYVNRHQVQLWQPNKEALKSYNVQTNGISVLDQTGGSGSQYSYVSEYYTSVSLLGNEVAYIKDWNGWSGGSPATLNSVQADGSQKKTVKTYTTTPGGYQYASSRLSGFRQLIIEYNGNGNKSAYDQYQNGKVTPLNISDADYRSILSRQYYVSPSGNKVYWNENRDGQNVFFVGDDQAQNAKQLPGSSADYTADGWFTDNYVLLSKKGRELHIMPAGGVPGGPDTSFKISDYYPGNVYYAGY